MKHKFRITRYTHVKLGNYTKTNYKSDDDYREVDIEVGEKYLCIETYTGHLDERSSGYDSIFTKGNYYTLVSFTTDEATFIKNGGGSYFIRSFMDGALFTFFDFKQTLSGMRNSKIDDIIND